MAERTLVHVARMPIRWGDMDMMGHVNNAKYFTYIETARIDWFTSIACSPKQTETSFCAWISKAGV